MDYSGHRPWPVGGNLVEKSGPASSSDRRLQPHPRRCPSLITLILPSSSSRYFTPRRAKSRATEVLTLLFSPPFICTSLSPPCSPQQVQEATHSPSTSRQTGFRPNLTLWLPLVCVYFLVLGFSLAIDLRRVLHNPPVSKTHE
jgi:hypothetical protein